MGTNTGRPSCLKCRGKGGVRLYDPHTGASAWLKCDWCFPKPTRAQAAQAAIDRYLTGNRNELARKAVLRFIDKAELDRLILAYDERKLFP